MHQRASRPRRWSECGRRALWLRGDVVARPLVAEALQRLGAIGHEADSASAIEWRQVITSHCRRVAAKPSVWLASARMRGIRRVEIPLRQQLQPLALLAPVARREGHVELAEQLALQPERN